MVHWVLVGARVALLGAVLLGASGCEQRSSWVGGGFHEDTHWKVALPPGVVPFGPNAERFVARYPVLSEVDRVHRLAGGALYLHPERPSEVVGFSVHSGPGTCERLALIPNFLLEVEPDRHAYEPIELAGRRWGRLLEQQPDGRWSLTFDNCAGDVQRSVNLRGRGEGTLAQREPFIRKALAGAELRSGSAAEAALDDGLERRDADGAPEASEDTGPSAGGEGARRVDELEPEPADSRGLSRREEPRELPMYERRNDAGSLGRD